MFFCVWFKMGFMAEDQTLPCDPDTSVGINGSYFSAFLKLRSIE